MSLSLPSGRSVHPHPSQFPRGRRWVRSSTTTLGVGFLSHIGFFILFSLCIHVCVHTVHAEARGQLWVLFLGCRMHLSKARLPVSSALGFPVDLRYGFSLNLQLIIWVTKLSSDLQGSACLCPLPHPHPTPTSSSGITNE